MARRTLSALVLGLLLAGLGTVATSPAPVVADTPPERPNIVMFYIDDAAPHDGRLWNDPSRTPNIYDQFIAHGVHLDHAIGETPLCCLMAMALLNTNGCPSAASATRAGRT